MRRILLLATGGLLLALPAFSQQSGSISGTVTLADGSAVPGVVIEADSEVLPRPRATTSGNGGDYQLPLLPPGEYELTFTMENMATVTRSVRVYLGQSSVVGVAMGIEEQIEVISSSLLVDPSSAELKASLAAELIDQLPVGQEYRDVVKLIPGVQYTEDSVRGPSAGGSGQDNVYLFDGVNVGRPLFGTLSAEPSSHDIEDVSVVKGGAKATDFNRSGGFTINSVSKSGTDRLQGIVSYQVQTEGMTGDRDTGSQAEFEEDRDWAVVSLGGPLVSERLHFYASYYRPTRDRGNQGNLYGAVPDFESTRDELFGKLTWSPSDSLLLGGSYRDSEREESGIGVLTDGGFDEAHAGSTSQGSDVTLNVSILEGSWILSDKSFLAFKYTDFENETSSRPDLLFDFPVRIDGSVPLDVANLDRQGLLLVPQFLAGDTDFNLFIAPLIGRYGYLQNGIPTGGGRVGGASTLNDQDFFRESFQVSFDYLIDSGVSHELHIGYQWSAEEEEVARTSNGWGAISVPGGRTTTSDGTPIFFEARFEQMSIADEASSIDPLIRSEFETQSIELNDTIRWRDWTFNIGVMLSNDELFGEGLRENSTNVSGFELAPGNKYKMYEVDFDEMIQPRLGAVWAYGDAGTLYANYARYHPAAGSLPRAASWARNLRRSIRAFFDAGGNLISTDAVRSSSGKFFAADLDPRSIDEYLIGTSRRLSRGWTVRAHGRYRYGSNFWEDTNNNARSRFEPPPGIPRDDYIPNLDEVRAEIGGSSYVIAELDGAFTKYYEGSVEAEWKGGNAYFRGSYVASHYYGNFDQDNTTTENDADTFVGSSFIADGAGRQLWNFREGNLRGDRRHQLKLYGYYSFRWDGSAGIYAIYQSGQPWEAWDVEVYRQFTSSSSDTSRFAEPAGSRTTGDHYQVDLNYTHNFRFGNRYNVQLRADLFNVFDRQTGYNIQNKVNSSGFGDARSFFNPRRLQLAVRFEF